MQSVFCVIKVPFHENVCHGHKFIAIALVVVFIVAVSVIVAIVVAACKLGT